LRAVAEAPVHQHNRDQEDEIRRGVKKHCDESNWNFRSKNPRLFVAIRYRQPRKYGFLWWLSKLWNPRLGPAPKKPRL
jgi:hypothetical protein